MFVESSFYPSDVFSCQYTRFSKNPDHVFTQGDFFKLFIRFFFIYKFFFYLSPFELHLNGRLCLTRYFAALPTCSTSDFLYTL